MIDKLTKQEKLYDTIQLAKLIWIEVASHMNTPAIEDGFLRSSINSCFHAAEIFIEEQEKYVQEATKTAVS